MTEAALPMTIAPPDAAIDIRCDTRCDTPCDTPQGGR